MKQYDVFNGDADGICALHQLRLEQPTEGELVTGVKRDISLLARVKPAPGDRVTVLDISLDKNRGALEQVLADGARVEYFDHHFAGEIPDHPALDAHIDTTPDVCTSLLVDRALGGRQRAWAVVGAFGDNLYDRAREAAEPLGLEAAQLDALCELGTCLNYNGYGVALEDLFFHPAELYRLISRYADPFAFMAEEPGYQRLKAGYDGDMAQAAALQPEIVGAHHALFILPDEPWARRVSGVFGNDLARQYPERAHALLTRLPGEVYRVSVRAPLTNRTGADELCRAFPTGGGRQAAAGINELPEAQFAAFVEQLRATYG